MLAELTEEQEKLMPIIAQKWIDRACKLDENIPDKVYADKYKKLYKLIGMKEPEVIVAESPLSAQLIVKVLRASGASIRESVVGFVWDSVENSVENSVRDSVWASVEKSVRESAVDSVVDSVWASVRESVRESIKNSVVESVEKSVSASVGNSIWDSVRNSIWASFEKSIGDSVKEPVENSIWDSVEKYIWDSVGESVRNSIWASVKDSVVESVGKSISASVEKSVRELEPIAYHGDISDYYWIAFYDYFSDVIPDNIPDIFLEYRDIVYSAPSIGTLFYDGLVVVAKAPKRVHFDDENRISNDEGMAIEFADGWGVYALDGVRFSEELFYSITKREITAEEVAKLDNTEQRMVAFKYLSPEEFIIGSKANMVGLPTDRGNTLYKGSFEETGDIYFLRFQCPSTGRDYIEFTDPEGYSDDLKRLNGEDISIYNPDALQAYSFVHESSKGTKHLSLADYLKMDVET